MICPKCQTPNQDDATNCTACGAGLAGMKFAAAMMFLVFMPPAAYRSFVERRARAI